jgi:hypothetical protein
MDNKNQNPKTELAFGIVELIFLAISIFAGIIAMSSL